jgi:O-antigen ligase
LVLAFVFYANLPVVATRFHRAGTMTVVLVGCLLIVPLVVSAALRRERLRIDAVLLAMAVYLAVMLAAALFAAGDVDTAAAQVGLFVLEGVAVYAVVINGIRRLSTLRQIVVVLLLVGSLLGALNVYQELAHDYRSQFGGLAQRNLALENETFGDAADVSLTRRAAGPIGEANRYAQVMLVLLPLALFHYRWGGCGWRRLPVALVIFCILSAVFLTYSRGAFLVLGMLFLTLIPLGTLPPLRALVAGLGLLILVSVIAPGYLTRMGSLRRVEGLFDEGRAALAPDGAVRGRATEMLAALHVFLDHPILGVGPGQYAPYYSVAYQRDPDIAFRFLPTSRRAHSLYVEVAAELGMLGFLAFAIIVCIVLSQLWSLRHRLRDCRPDLSALATAVFFSVAAYLGTAIFLHLSYQRYFWFLLALAGATIHVIHDETASTSPREHAGVLP